MISGDYRIERLTKETVKDIWKLFNIMDNTSHDLNYYENKFDTSFTGVSYVGFLAYHVETNQPAAFYGVFPCYVNYDGNKILAAQSGDTITHPAHQKKGLFILLAQETYKLARQLGILVVFGFPNDNSKHGFYQKLGWKRNEDLLSYRFEVFSFPLFRIFRKLRLLNFIYDPYINLIQYFFPADHKCPQNSLASTSSAYVYRDDSYYRYKKYGKSYLITLLGITIWFKVEDSLIVGDVWTKEGVESKQIVFTLKMLSFLLGINSINFIVSAKSKYDLLLGEKYPSIFKLTAGHINLKDPTNEINFTHMWADSDTF